jgi:transcriptional regulator with XRE-family HTH domain
MIDAKQEAHRLLDRLRVIVCLSPLRHREIEQRAGFSRGYLSQILCGNVELKFRHLITILDAVEVSPAELFAELYPRRRRTAAELLDSLPSGSRLREDPFVAQLAQLFAFGIEALIDLYERLERCEDALYELGEIGLLDRSKIC